MCKFIHIFVTVWSHFAKRRGILFGLEYMVYAVAGRASCENVIDSSCHLTGIRRQMGPLARYLRPVTQRFVHSH
jgi:hypothetical protein